jgi:metal-responsive CopG/Arc/MetJ family transcriptional regulator
MRLTVDIPEKLLKSLDELCSFEDRDHTSVIREALSEYLKKRSRSSLEAAFGLWRGRKMDSLKYEDNLRSEW